MTGKIKIIQRGKRGIVLVGQRATARYDAATVVIANSLEFPHAANQFEVANMLAAAGEHAARLGVDGAKVRCDGVRASVVLHVV